MDETTVSEIATTIPEAPVSPLEPPACEPTLSPDKYSNEVLLVGYINRLIGRVAIPPNDRHGIRKLYVQLLLSALNSRDLMPISDQVLPPRFQISIGGENPHHDSFLDRVAESLENYFERQPSAIENFEYCISAKLRDREYYLPEVDPALTTRLNDLASKLALTAHERAIVQFFHITGCESWMRKMKAFLPLAHFYSVVAAATELTFGEVKHCFRKSGRLMILEIFDVSRDADAGLSPAVKDYLTGVSSDEFGSDHYRIDRESVLPLESFSSHSKDIERLLPLLKRDKATAVLFYGQPGVGKTELSRALSRETGRPTYVVLAGEDNELRGRKIAMQICANLAEADSGIVIVDEADDLINTAGSVFSKGPTDKAFLNNFLDGCRATMIWITNNASEIEDSVKRRFDYSIKFSNFSNADRKRFWQTSLKSHILGQAIRPTFIEEASARFRVNASGIARALA